jgi:hypothetical protein
VLFSQTFSSKTDKSAKLGIIFLRIFKRKGTVRFEKGEVGFDTYTGYLELFSPLHRRSIENL